MSDAKPRSFRNALSLKAEELTRAAVKPFLEQRGFEVTNQPRRHGLVVSQIVTARRGAEDVVTARVRICWNREDRTADGAKYAAAQLFSGLKDGDWDKTLYAVGARERKAGNSHNLFVQWDQGALVHAALVPSDQIASIWRRQHEVYADLIGRRALGKVTKNPVENGNSPTIYLQDDRTAETPNVAKLFWTWPGVIDLNALTPQGGDLADDIFDDLRDNPSPIGRDSGERHSALRSGFTRDRKVREAVLKRADGVCEREGCGATRPFPGFLDVHHILGVYSSDRVWSCVALCPNCHREAHRAPDRDEINAALQIYAGDHGAALVFGRGKSQSLAPSARDP